MAENREFAVFGLGTFGFEVAKTLGEKGGKVIAIDTDKELIEKIKEFVDQSICLDSTDEGALKSLGIENVDVAVVGIGENIEASILTTALLKNLGIPYIITRAVTELHAQVLKQIGASEVLIIESEEGKRIAQRILSPQVIDKIIISKDQTLVEIEASKSLWNKSLDKLNLRKKYNVNIISIKRIRNVIDNYGNPKQEEIVITPKPDDIIKKDDILIVIGSDESIDNFKGV